MHSAISNHFAEYIQDYEPFKMNLVVPCSVIVHLPKKMGESEVVRRQSLLPIITYLGDFGSILRSILVIMIQILVIVIPNN